MLTILSTSDVSLQELESVFSTPEFQGMTTVDPRQYFFRSLEPPSWIQVLSTADFWVQLLAGGISVYAAAALSEAGKDSWKQRAKLKGAAKAAGTTLRELAVRLVTLQNLVGSRTRLQAGIPLHDDDHYAALLTLTSNDEAGLELQLARLSLHASQLQAMFGRPDFKPLGWVMLEISDAGALIARWMDRETLAQREETLELNSKISEKA